MANGDIYAYNIGGYDGTNAGGNGVLSLQSMLDGLENLLSNI